MMKPLRFLLLFGSQTGQSKAIAEEIADVANSKGFDVRLHCCSETSKKFNLEQERCIVIVTSSTGDGEPPDTVRKLWRRIKKKDLSDKFLEGVNFALLGLGDSNYNSHGRFPLDLEKQLLSLGAKSFYPTVIADDGVGLEIAVDPWIEGLWSSLEIFLDDSKQHVCCGDTSPLSPIPNGDIAVFNNEQTNSIKISEVLHDNTAIDKHLSQNIDTRDKFTSKDESVVLDGSTTLDESWGSERNVVGIDQTEGISIEEFGVESVKLEISSLTHDECTNTAEICSLPLNNQSSSIDTLAHQRRMNEESGNNESDQFVSADNPYNSEVTSSSKNITRKDTKPKGESIEHTYVDNTLKLATISVSKSSGAANREEETIHASTNHHNSTICNFEQEDVNDAYATNPDSSPNILNPTTHVVVSSMHPSTETTVQNCSTTDSDAESLLTHEITPKMDDLSFEARLDVDLVGALIAQAPSPFLGLDITIPKALPEYLNMSYDRSSIMDTTALPYQNDSKFPFAASEIFECPITSFRQLTKHGAIKTTMELVLDISHIPIVYKPGDALSIICQNNCLEVGALLSRLGVAEVADCPYTITIDPDTRKKNPSIPVHVPPTATLRFLFTTCLDIREPPKKATLRTLADYTNSSTERQWLLDMCSIQGAAAYNEYIRLPGLSLLDVLLACPSCKPPVPRLIERLPRLLPRPYSAASSALSTPNTIKFVFNIVDIKKGQGRLYNRQGLCTGWLTTIAQQENTKVSIFSRAHTSFHLPSDHKLPIIMIGPGTGVAPFIGFLEHRKQLLATQKATIGEAWLFFGCRHETKDYIYREELQQYLETGALSRLCVSFSRDTQSDDSPRYVQDNISHHSDEVVRLVQSNAVIYVCGEAKNMARSVLNKLVSIFVEKKGLTKEESEAMFQNLRHEKRYLEDVW